MRFSASLPIIILLFVLTACQPPANHGLGVTLDAKTTETVLEQVAESDSSISDAFDETLNPENSAEDTLTVAALPTPPAAPTPPAPAPLPRLRHQDLIGISLNDLTRRLGAADYVRIDADIEIYQYRLETCVIDFVAMLKSDDRRQITSSHSRHRKMGMAYDEETCQLDLGKLSESL